MTLTKFRGFFVRFASIALVSAGFAPFSFAGVVGTEYLVEADARAAGVTRVEAFLARDDVARQLQDFGVDEADIQSRLSGLTHAELLALEGQIERQVAGGDALGVIGAVFLVLLILELVGVTDIFKSL